MKIKTIIFATVAAFVIASLIGCAPGPVEIESITTCKNVDSDYKPVDPTTAFPSGTSIIYASIKVKNITTEDKLTVKWNYLETGEEINTTDFITDEDGSGYIGFSIIVDEGFPSGRYNAMVFLNNELFETVEFSVE